MNTPLTEDQIKQIHELKEKRFKNSTIAVMVGCNRNTVLYHTSEKYRHSCRSAGGRQHGKRLSNEQISKIMEMHKCGKSGLKIARLLGINVVTVYRYTSPERRQKDINRQKSYPAKERPQSIIKKERGGKCELCGFDKHYNCLDFHHKDPSTKSFEIARKSGYSVDVLRKETDKCALVCKNCHYLIHAGVIQIPLTQSYQSTN
jgi:hypothetical protein